MISQFQAVFNLSLIADGKISFADMLEIMHNHSQKENIPQEILRAFRASDKTKSGRIPARELRHILLLWGEKLSPKEGKCLLSYCLMAVPYVIT